MENETFSGPAEDRAAHRILALMTDSQLKASNLYAGQMADIIGEEFAPLLREVRAVISAYGDNGWIKSEMCWRLRKAIASIEWGESA